MSTSVDNRVVSMRFDNKQFESGTKQTMSTLSKLKEKLNLPGASKGLENIGAASKRVSFDGISRGVEAVQFKFSALQVVAITALTNITNSAINAGKELVRSLTIAPIKDGYEDYNRKLTSVQTIMNATGKDIDTVGGYFSQLDTYADKTIYNLDDMTSSFAKFTNAGVDMEKSVPAIKGIANMVALAGQDAGAAQIAMYNLSQSIAGGFLTRMDFKSLELANVATKEWKNQMIQGAVAAGTLTETSEGMFLAKGAKEAVSSTALFVDELSKGWATSEVLLGVLGQYGDETTDIGSKAQSAAQDVKSFSMMMDTLKASVGTGWTDTFEILVGNLIEAKALFTPLTNTIGGFLDASAEARNSLLQGWKDLGGRTALIETVKNSFTEVMRIVTVIGEAFREIFPAITADQLFKITDGLRDFTSRLKLSDKTLTNLKTTFKGLFAMLDIGKMLFSAVAKAVIRMFGGVGDLGSNVLDVTANIGEWLISLNEMIKKSDIFNKVLSNIVDYLGYAVDGLKFVFKSILNFFDGIIVALSDKFKIPGLEAVHSFLGVMNRRMEDIGESAGDMQSGVSTAFEVMSDAIANSPIYKILTTLWNGVKKITSSIGDLIVSLLDKFTEAFDNANFSSIFDAVAAISIGGMLLAFKKFMKSLGDTLEESKGFFGNIKGILDDVRGSLEAYQQNLKAGVLLKIALAIGILSASIVAISLIDSEKLVTSLAAIGTLFTQLLVAMKVYSKIGKFKGQVVKSSMVMLVMSTSILILSSAVKKLAELDWVGLTKGLVGVGVLASLLVASAKILSSNSGAMIKGSSGMVVFALAIKILASACADLSKLSWEELAKGLIGVGVLLAAISLFLNTAKFSMKSIVTATGILILAAAMKVLASACKDFGNLSWEEISKGLVSIGLLLAEMAIFTKLTGNAKSVISTAVSLVIIASAMKILASAVKDFGSMSWEEIAKGLAAMGGALIEITIALKLMPKNMIATGLGLVIVGAALNIMAAALKNMGSMSWEEISRGLVAMGGALAILAIGLYAMNGTLIGSAALLIAAGAIAILTPALSVLGAMSWEGIVKGLVSIAGIFVILGVSALVLAPLIPVIFALSASLVLLGAGIIGIGAGLLLVGLGISALATGFGLLATMTATGATAVVGALSIIVAGVAALIPLIAIKLAQGIIDFVATLGEGVPIIAAAVTDILLALIDTIIAVTPQVMECIQLLITSLLTLLVDTIPAMVDAGMKLILGILEGIAANIAAVVAAGIDIILQFILGVASKVPDIIDTAFKVIISFINGLADAIRNNRTAINNACKNLIDAIVESVTGFAGKIKDIGKNIISGIIDGFKNMGSALVDAAKGVVGGAVDGVKNFLGIHSPSRVFAEIGRYSALGMADGLEDYAGKVSTAATDVGVGAVDSLKNAMSNISDVVNGDIDMTPTIRPVLDLSDVTAGAGTINSMLGKNHGITIDSATRRASVINARMTPNVSEIQNGSNKQGSKQEPTTPKPAVLQLMLQNGQAIAEYIVDDLDSLLGNKNQITGRMVGI